ncbi:MAG: HAMP domain-containing histidine kinase [Oligoflexia bacterium]|nr:HAMP domain-containing histidine kinase [Oligoflexia bacterium]
MSWLKHRYRILGVLTWLWLALTVSLTSWWMIYALSTNQKLSGHELPQDIIRANRMLYFEGATLIGLLILGGVALIYLVHRERKRSRQIEEFFAVLTHELKTPLASLRLQVESLIEDNRDKEPNPLLTRLLNDSVRLELQLENALFIAGLRSQNQLHKELVSLGELVQRLKIQWPQLQIKIDGDVKIKTDIRAFDGVLKNLIQNAAVHGKANEVVIRGSTKNGKTIIEVTDPGRGFEGNFGSLGKTIFYRPQTRSGSGIGLYLSRRLLEQMNGSLEFVTPSSGKGFCAKISLPDSGAR